MGLICVLLVQSIEVSGLSNFATSTTCFEACYWFVHHQNFKGIPSPSWSVCLWKWPCWATGHLFVTLQVWYAGTHSNPKTCKRSLEAFLIRQLTFTITCSANLMNYIFNYEIYLHLAPYLLWIGQEKRLFFGVRFSLSLLYGVTYAEINHVFTLFYHLSCWKHNLHIWRLVFNSFLLKNGRTSTRSIFPL